MDASVTTWIDKIKEGDEIAAQQLWERYYSELVTQARKKLKVAPARMADEDDVVLDAFNSFCNRAKKGAFPQLSDRDDLWQILVMLTNRKAINQIKRERRKKRGGGKVRGDSIAAERGQSDVGGFENFQGNTPTPEMAAMLVEQLQEKLNRLDSPLFRQIALLKLEGYTQDEIAERLDCSSKTVGRKLRIIRMQLEQEMEIDGD